MNDFEKGYYAAIDDVQEAMRLAEVTEIQPSFSGEIIYNNYNHPEKFIEELKKLRAKRFQREEKQ